MPGAGPLPEVFGKYRLVRKLGQGGMGAVYLAHDTQLDRDVALKVPHLGEEAGPEVLARFLREARAAAKLHHPNVCPIHEVGEVNGAPYFTMPLIEGPSLSAVLRANGPLGQREAAALVARVAQALALAHGRGVVHRDLKPSNILLDARGEPVVTDFGLARVAEGRSRLTPSGAVLGTPAYMPPEQARGDVRAV